MAVDYDDAYSRSRPGPAFANGSEGYGWMAAWCDRCKRDAPFRSGLKGATGCPLLAVAYGDRIPAEWLDGPRDEHGAYGIATQYTCIEFRPFGGGGGEPRPVPTPPDQGALFERPPTRPRMLAPLPEDQSVVADVH